MNAECDRITTLVPGWVDHELTMGEQAEVERHLRACAVCRAQADDERGVRELLQARADALREVAPAPLRGRVRAVRGAPAGARPAPAHGHWRLPLAAALVLGLFGAGAAGLLLPSGTALAAELALDHVKCRLLARVEPGATPEGLAQRWAATGQHWTIAVPPGDAAHHLTLKGLRRCLYHGGSVAHLLYDYEGQTVSLYVMPRSSRAGAPLELLGTSTVTWSAGNRTFGLVSDAPRAELAGLEAYFQQHLHD